MDKKKGYIKKEDRKTILLLCDDIRMHSGIATMAREFVIGTAHRFNWINLGAAINHPEVGKNLDLSVDINKNIGIEDSSVIVIPNNGYGDTQMIRNLMGIRKPDAIFIFTDPRYWVWLFEIEREIRSKIPIVWLNIWDDYPAPKYNEDYYNSVDGLMAISKQTLNINKLVLGDKAENKVLSYIPHGINDKTFFPIKSDHKLYDDFLKFKTDLFNGKDYKFVVYFNSRNIHRKRPGDTILAFRYFCDLIGKEAARECALVMHTQVSDSNGTDLRAVKEALTDPDYVNIYFSNDKLTPQQMNLLYNVADLTLLLSSNEGWGLSLTESMMTSTMISANVTGGMQDQMRFEDENGDWIDFDADFPSNHRGTYKKHGEWAFPVYPACRSVQGSPPTPYIYDDRCKWEDISERYMELYKMTREERKAVGLKGREWAISDEAGFTGEHQAYRVMEAFNTLFDTWKPREKYEIINATESKPKYLNHKIIY